ncbi:MAG: DUF1801 domain-containing protein [Pseudomonadota bacterium]
MTEKKPVKLLSSGNPQIPKGEGDAPVQDYIAAMPEWKHAVGVALDALIVAHVPNVAKAVKWNTPLYGNPGDGWFLSFYCYKRYVTVTFHKGSALEPLPPKASKHPDVRYFDVFEGDPVDTPQMIDWIKQASRLPGEKL